VGHGYEKKLEKVGLHTMGDIARCSLGAPGSFYSEDLLYKLFGINAELLIDHAWGWEPCTIGDIKAYRPATTSISSGQVLHCAYTADLARLIIREMTDLLVLDMVDKGLLTNQLVLNIGYDIENLTDPRRCKLCSDAVTTDHYGRKIPKHAHGTIHLPGYSSSTREIMETVTGLYDRIVNQELLVRRLTVTACNVIRRETEAADTCIEQLDFFSEPAKSSGHTLREHSRQKAVLTIKKRFGKNAIVRGMNLEEGATAMDRNRQIGGHKA